MRRAAIALLLLTLACRTAQPPVDAALKASIDRVEGLIVQQPANTAFMYILATYYDRARDVPNTVRWLTRLDELEWDLGVDASEFPNSSRARSFRRIAGKLAAREHVMHRAETAFTFPKERKVRSEGIAYDPVDDVFYFSGGKDRILRVDRGGTITEVTVAPAGEKFGRLGMDVDAGRRQLWVVNAAFAPDVPADEKGRSAVSVYDLRDGRLLRRVMHGSAAEPSFLNDLTLLRDGTAFVTDSGRHHVLRLAPDATTFETWAEDFRGPNGIAVSADERTLYVADFRGLNAFDIASKSRRLLETTTLLNGIDGLLEHDGALIGIQNVLGRPRVLRIHVNDGNRVELLESKSPRVTSPATGVVAGGHYYFLANLSGDDDDKVILRIPL